MIATKKSKAPSVSIRTRRGEPAWEIAGLFPLQGYWRESDYLALETNRLVELVDGCIEVLPMPSAFHQLIVDYLHGLLQAFIMAHGLGLVFFSPLPVRLGQAHYREPDVLFIKRGRKRTTHGHFEGADLVMEVVSPGAENRKRDLEEKKVDYAKARIGEYWIVDPELEQITVLALKGKTYRTHGVFGRGTTATSILLPGFSVSVDEVIRVNEQLN